MELYKVSGLALITTPTNASWPNKTRYLQEEPIDCGRVPVQKEGGRTVVAPLPRKSVSGAPHLMAYQSTIVKCAKRYDGLGWVAYDMQYRRMAAQTKSLYWGVIDQSAYAEWFTGSSKTGLQLDIARLELLPLLRSIAPRLKCLLRVLPEQCA